MLIRLSVRNAVRLWKDYLVFFLTLFLVTALIFSFNSLRFSPEVTMLTSREDGEGFAMMVKAATFFICLVMGWLVYYIYRFIMEKRSSEYATWLLFGMSTRNIVLIYHLECLVIGAAAFAAGIGLGIFLRQAIFFFYQTLVGKSYNVSAQWDIRGLWSTIICFMIFYVPSMLSGHRQLNKVNIAALMNIQRRNEEVKEVKISYGVTESILGMAYVLFFIFYLYYSRDNAGAKKMALLIAGLIPAVYIFFSGISTFFVLYIKKNGKGMYRGTSIFLFRQLASKIRTLRFTFGTLTLLLVLSLLALSVVPMLNTYAETQLAYKYPFSMSIHSDAGADLDELISVVKGQIPDAGVHGYHIYENGTGEIRRYLFDNLGIFRRNYSLPDGSLDLQTLESKNFYYAADTFMKLSDYNILRSMLGLEEVSVGENGFLLQIKNRVYKEAGEGIAELSIPAGEKTLKMEGVYTDGFCQDGHNGADYLLVVADKTADGMNPFYSGMEVMIPDGVSEEVIDQVWADVYQHCYSALPPASGTDDFVLSVTNILIAKEMYKIKDFFPTVTLPLSYAGLVYLCAALTVLSVQQLSSAEKDRHRYRLLFLLGLNRKQIDKTIFVQMAEFYLIPIVFALLIGGAAVLMISNNFQNASGVEGPVFGYLGYASVIILGIYFVYFLLTYIVMVRNVNR